MYGWPLRGPDASGDEDEDVVSKGLKQELLD